MPVGRDSGPAFPLGDAAPACRGKSQGQAGNHDLGLMDSLADVAEPSRSAARLEIIAIGTGTATLDGFGSLLVRKFPAEFDAVWHCTLSACGSALADQVTLEIGDPWPANRVPRWDH
jgi:hypothetical protein